MPRRATSKPTRRMPSSQEQVDNLTGLYGDGKPQRAPRRADSKVEHLRMPPQSVEAEQAVLGGMMLKPDSFWEVKTLLDERDFYRRDHQLIFRAIEAMAADDKPYDSVTMGVWFEEQGLREQVPGNYLVELASTTPSAANIVAYAEIVRDKAMLRRLIEVGTSIVNDGFKPDGRTPQEIQAEAVSGIEATDRRLATDGSGIVGVMTGVYEDMQDRFTRADGDVPGLVTPYPVLTEYLGGWQRQRLYYIGARPKMGKSIMLTDIARFSALQGKRVALFTLEMSKTECGYRMLAAESGVEYKKLERPKLMEQDEWTLAVEAMRRLRETSVMVFEEPAIMVERVLALCTVLKARGMLDMVVLDYLQIMGAPRNKERRDLEIGHNSLGLKNLAKRLDVPVVCAGQLNRANESGHAVRYPRMSDARESGNIEQDVDAMILIHRPSYYDKKQARGTRVEIAANRSGDTTVFRLEEDLARSRFNHTNRPWSDDGQTDDDGGFS